MVIVFTILITFTGLKQEISCCHLKDHACKRPNISGCIVLWSNNDFRRSILSRLNLRRKMVVSPASISKVAYLQLQVFAKLGSSAFSFIFIKLVLHLTRIHDVKFKEGDSKFLRYFITLVLRIFFKFWSNSSWLTDFKLSAVRKEIFKFCFFALDTAKVKRKVTFWFLSCFSYELQLLH
jgi:hypothetical protein